MASDLLPPRVSDVLLACFAVAFVWAIVKILRAKASRKRPLPPGPPPNWFYGNADVMRSNPETRHLTLLQLHKKYGKVVSIQLGRPPLYGSYLFSIADPKLCEEILKTKTYNSVHVRTIQDRFIPVLGANSLVTLDSEKWRTHRRLIMPLFHSGFLSYTLEVISHKTKLVIEKWRELPKSTSVEAFSVVQALTLDIISQAAFGYDLKVQENPNDETVQALGYFVRMLGDRAFLLIPRLWEWMHPFKAHCGHQLRRVLDNFVNQIIQERKSNNEARNDLLTLLLRAQDPESKYRLTDVEVHDEILTFLFGGFETVTSQLCWVLFHLAQNPEIQTTAQEEVDRVLGDSDVVTADMDKELKYVGNCIKESQRLIPALTGFSRGVAQDSELGGFHIPKGSIMFLDSYVLHHSGDLWDNPEQFDPTRWDDKMAVHTFSFLPFGGGSRRCAGQPLAVVEMKAVIALILRNFSLTLDESKPLVTKVELAFGPREIHFFLRKRN